MFSTLFFYIISASVILIYGVGVKDLIQTVDNPKNVVLFFLKTLFSVIFIVLISWPILTFVFAQNNISDIFPFFLLFITILFSILFSFFIKLVLKIEIKEFSLSFLIAFISINEGFSLPNALFIAIAATIAFYILIPIFYSIKNRINLSTANIDFKSFSLILLSIALFLFIMFSFNISWFNLEVA